MLAAPDLGSRDPVEAAAWAEPGPDRGDLPELLLCLGRSCREHHPA